VDRDDCTSINQGRLPAPDEHCTANSELMQRLGISWRELTALMGVHTIGTGEEAFSGFVGQWTKKNDKFNNDFYKDLLKLPWVPDTAENGRLFFKLQDAKGSRKNRMMLSTDMCLAWKTEEQQCDCSGFDCDGDNDCSDTITGERSEAWDGVIAFAASTSTWWKELVNVWHTVTENGHNNLVKMDKGVCS